LNRILILMLFVSTPSFAGNARAPQTLASRVSTLIRQCLTEKIAGVEIRIPSFEKLMLAPPMSRFNEISSVRLVVDRPNGSAQFEVVGTDINDRDAVETIQTPYEAWKKVPIATHRIYPNTKLRNEDFRVQEVNVASGSAREYRGVMLPADTRFSSMQSKQTILEGQYVVSSAIQQAPDLRKGDSVRLELISGDLVLTTQATAEESATIGSQIRVVTTKTKRELVGIVKEDHSVEVTL
jgi:flagella basal body P-ring formation protein FlgA